MVARGEELVEIETDKAAMVYESDQEGTLEIVAGEGATLAVGEVIARVGSTAGASSDGPASGGPARTSDVDGVAATDGSHTAGSAAPVTADSAPTVDVAAPAVDAPAPTPDAATPALSASDSERVKASPLAKRIAAEGGIDLHGVTGSGPGGRIVKADVLAPAAGSAAQGAPVNDVTEPVLATPSPEPSPEVSAAPQQAALAGVTTAKGETVTVELTRTQQTIARRMAESKATIPDFTLQMDVDMEDCVALRSELKRLSQPDAPAQPGSSAPAVAPTYNDMVVKATALALREHPRANGSYRDGKVQLHSRVNVGVAVASRGRAGGAHGLRRGGEVAGRDRA